MKRAPLSTGEKRLLIGSALAVPLIIVAGTVLLGDPNGGIPPHAALPKPNGFDLYLAAASAMTRPNPPVDAVNDSTIRTPAVAAKLYTSARRAAFVSANSKVWSLMRQARALQTEHPDTRLNLYATPPFRYGALRELARGKTIEAKHFKDIQRFDLALQSGLDTLEMGHDVEHGAPIIGSLVGIAVEAIGAQSLGDVPPHLSAIEAKNGARRLEKIIAAGASPAAAMIEEKWTILTQARQGFGPRPNRAFGVVGAPFIAPIGPMMDSCIAQLEKPYALQKMPPPPTGFFDSMAVTLHSIYIKSGFSFARREATESNLLLRLALRAYRLEHGAYPQKLTQLTPQYLAKIPRDAFGRGEPLRYRKTGDSYLAWSIGPDGIDNRGVSIPISRSKKRYIILLTSRGDAVTKP